MAHAFMTLAETSFYTRNLMLVGSRCHAHRFPRARARFPSQWLLDNGNTPCFVDKIPFVPGELDEGEYNPVSRVVTHFGIFGP